MDSIIEHAVKIPLYKVSEEDFKKLGYKSVYANDIACPMVSNRWFLMYPLQACRMKRSDRYHPTTNCIIEPKKDCIYFYGTSFHEEPSEEQLPENVFVINQILNTKATDEIRYKRYILKVVNILHFLDMTEMAFPKEVLANINTFSAFFKDYFGITISKTV